MPNTVQLTQNGQPVYPVTDVSLIIGLEERSGMRVIPYTTRPTASAETAGFIYMDESTQDLYITKATSGSYSWVSAGNLSNIDLDNYATKTELEQLGQEMDNIVTPTGSDADLDITDENYFVLARFKNGHIRTKNFDSESIEKIYKQKDLDNFFNGVAEKQHYDTVASTTKNLSFPYDLKKNVCFALNAEFSSFATITIGKGYNTYSGYWFVIDSTNISLYYNQGSTVLAESVAHGLTFSDFVKIIISNIGDDYCRFFIQTKSGQFAYLFEWIFSANGQTFLTTTGTLTNVDFIASCSDLKNDVWVFGDSYVGFANPARWPKQLRNMGYSDYLCDGLAGQSSSGAYADLQRCLSLGVKPKYLIWALGMNDNDSAWNSTFQQVKTLCESNNITLILATVPTVPSRNKENINSTVRNSGYSFIDFAKAVGATSSGVWYSGYLYSDNVHPTELGAKALATQFIFDFILKH